MPLTARARVAGKGSVDGGVESLSGSLLARHSVYRVGGNIAYRPRQVAGRDFMHVHDVAERRGAFRFRQTPC
jgi:hypothetical protein